MTTLLVGGEPGASDGSAVADQVQICKFIAAISGTMTQFVWRSKAIGNCCFALYDDNAGVPNNLLAEDHASHAAVIGLNTYAFPETPIAEGVAYWLALNCDTDGMLYLNSASGGIGCKYRGPWAFHDAFFSPADGGWADRAAGYLFSAMGYGEPAGQCIWHF